MFKHILFDLDGTLTESHEGIVKSIAYALKKEGESTDGRLNKEIVIGPPLMVTFTKTYGFPEKKRADYMTIFRSGTVQSVFLKINRIRVSENSCNSCGNGAEIYISPRRSRRFTPFLFATDSAFCRI